MNNIKIEEIKKDSLYFNQVCALADANSATLGFLPRVVFEEYANSTNSGILIALKEDNFAGYLMYRIVKRKNRATIVHLCIDPNYRGSSIPKMLFEELKSRTLTLSGIGLTCRRDFEIPTKLWRKLGFFAKTEKIGRQQTSPSELTSWWFDHGHKTLFDYIEVNKRRVAIDTNIFIDFHNRTHAAPEAVALMSDWIREENEFVITSELFNDINKNKNPQIRKSQRTFADQYLRVKTSSAESDNALDYLKGELSKKINNNDESDLKHIALCIADPLVNFFITRDNDLINNIGAKVFDKYGFTIMNPTDLILQIDELYRIEEYKQISVAGTTIKRKRIQAGKQDKLADIFQNGAFEKRSKFLQTLRLQLIDLAKSECFVIQDAKENPLILYSFDRSQPLELSIPILRVNSKSENTKILRFLLLEFVRIASDEDRRLVRISDASLSEIVKETLSLDAFVRVKDDWHKITMGIAKPSVEVASYLEEILAEREVLKNHFRLHIDVLKDQTNYKNSKIMSEIERVFWPLKIVDSDLPILSIPINHVWASRWFDENLANQTLFGAEEERAFNREGVYYSAAKPPRISLPGRIMWYVTKNNNLTETQSIRACSHLDEIVIGTPKDLFKRFRHLGIYQWEDLIKLVAGDIDRQITAYRFSDTQLFSNPISYARWSELTNQFKGKNPPIQSPAIMPKEVFNVVYAYGINKS